MRSRILSTGLYLPERIITNEMLHQFPSGSIPLIEQKTGVKARRHADERQCTSDLAVKAAQDCLLKIKFAPQDIDAVILATSSPDRIQPATATRVQHRIGACRAFAFDVNSVCTGAIYALQIADSLIQAGTCEKVLVVAAEVYSKILNPRDFSTFPYFGDGAGAVLLSESSNKEMGLIDCLLKSDGEKDDTIQIPAGGTMMPYDKIANLNDIYFRMNGRAVYDFAITKGSEIVEQLMERCGTKREEIAFIIPHQANINIIKELARRLNIEMSKFVINLDKYGNTAAASVLIALNELVESGNAKTGNIAILVAFGGGLSWGAAMVRF